MSPPVLDSGGKASTRLNVFWLTWLVAFFLPVSFSIRGQLLWQRELVFPRWGLQPWGASPFLAIPIGVVALLIAIPILRRDYVPRWLFIYISVQISAVLLSLLVGWYGAVGEGWDQLVRAVMFLGPLLALPVGYGIGYRIRESSELLGRALVIVLTLTVPFQCAWTFLRFDRTPFLSANGLMFTVANNAQYGVAILASLTIILVGLSAANPESILLRTSAFVLLPFVGTAAVLGLSRTSLALVALAPIVLILATRGKLRRNMVVRSLIVILAMTSLLLLLDRVTTIIVGPDTASAPIGTDRAPDSVKSSVVAMEFGVGQITPMREHTVMDAVEDVPDVVAPQPELERHFARLFYWDFFLRSSFVRPTVFLFGHREIPSAKVLPSAHNMFIELLFLFGAVGLAPFLWLTYKLVDSMFRARERIWSDVRLLCLTMVVVFLFLVELNLKVGLRVFYPAIVSWFLAGVFFAWIRDLPLSGSQPQIEENRRSLQ